MRSDWQTRAWLLVIWTVGAVAIWVVANAVLNPGVSDEAVQECLAEGFFPPDECEDALERLEAEEEPALGLGASLLIWVAGCFLIWLVTRPRAEDSD
jgi:hypothetical protein